MVYSGIGTPLTVDLPSAFYVYCSNSNQCLAKHVRSRFMPCRKSTILIKDIVMEERGELLCEREGQVSFDVEC